ncbi:Imm8 family immunity protein [Streptosporangium sp. NPDC000239]|uniref:Imm8 family immunity protein n=1 Tax=Streptosporangium sp. NPDC000239 TaxID=3154248 RepID=UPI00331DC9A9
MKAEVKFFHSPDFDWESQTPENPERFEILLQLFVGPVGEDSSESFDVLVCTPSFLSGELGDSGIIDGYHRIIVSRFDRELIESYIHKIVRSVEEATWDELAAKVGRLGHWEFEDYDHRDVSDGA